MTDPPQPDPHLVQDLTDQIAGRDPANETYLAKASRLNMAALQAAEMTRPPGPTDPDDDYPLPPTKPADPTHPLNLHSDQMSDPEYQAALEVWRQTEEYQAPLRRYQEWLRARAQT